MAVIAVRGAALRAAGGVAIRKIRAAPDRWAVRIFRIATPPGARRRRAVPRTASAALKNASRSLSPPRISEGSSAW